jgi:hypothetical protein
MYLYMNYDHLILDIYLFVVLEYDFILIQFKKTASFNLL